MNPGRQITGSILQRIPAIREIALFWILILAASLLKSTPAGAQTVFLSEDFSTAQGDQAPAGWYIETVTGDPLIDTWRFDNPGRREPANPINEPFAVFDSDAYSNNDQAEEVYLISPVFDAISNDNILLEFNQYFRAGYGASRRVDVFNGTIWTSVYEDTETTSESHPVSIDISEHVHNKTGCRIRFVWQGNYSWFWIVDNVQVLDYKHIEGPFTKILEDFSSGEADWGDFDDDGDLDILSGNFIYKNSGNDTFSYFMNLGGSDHYQWDDFDNDDDLDILPTIAHGSLKVFENNSGQFTEIDLMDLSGFIYAMAGWGDYDNDGDLDFIMCAKDLDYDPLTKVYRNEGSLSFVEQLDINLETVLDGAIDWKDCDNDGDLDIFISGWTEYNEVQALLYRNDGDNRFEQLQANMIEGIFFGSSDWGDFDSDGDLDLLLSGEDFGGIGHTKLYENLGNCWFYENANIQFPNVKEGDASWGDYDGDGDLDVLIAGNGEAHVFKNDGGLTFSQDEDIELDGMEEVKSAWGDYDNDGDLDILMSGFHFSGRRTLVYRNNSSTSNTPPAAPTGLYTDLEGQEVKLQWDAASDAETASEALTYNIYIGSSAGQDDIIPSLSQISDGYRKVARQGNVALNRSFVLGSGLSPGMYYWGVQSVDNSFVGSQFANGTFTITSSQASGIVLENTQSDGAEFRWTPGSSERSIVFITKGVNGEPEIEDNITYDANPVYGLGGQSLNGWHCVYNGEDSSAVVSGLEGNSFYRIMVIAYSGESGEEVYQRGGNASNPINFETADQFTKDTYSVLPGLEHSKLEYGDYDLDGDLDLILMGSANPGGYTSVYTNIGSNVFLEEKAFVFPQLRIADAAWGDYDNDGDLDLLLCGQNSEGQKLTRLFRNEYGDYFEEMIDINFPGVDGGSADWGDFDNDGDLDLLLSGRSDDGLLTAIMRNDGSNSFTDLSSDYKYDLNFMENPHWVDYDNDMDLDIVSEWVIYRNEGSDGFFPQWDILLAYSYNGSVDHADYDNDGDQDLLIVGEETGKVAQLFRNNGDNTFTEVSNTNLNGVSYGEVSWGDYNNDGNSDIIIAGELNMFTYEATVYMNNGNSTFSALSTFQPYEDIFPSFAAKWLDSDDDGDLDLFVSNMIETNLFVNSLSRSNTPPSAPTGVSSYIEDSILVISWDKAEDEQTPQAALTYNLRVGTTEGGCEIMSSMSLPVGKRAIVGIGNVGHNTRWKLDLSDWDPLPEDLYISVQAIDNGFLGGFWSGQGSVTENIEADFGPLTACMNSEIQFEDLSYSPDYPITNYQWKFIEGDDSIVSNLESPAHTFKSAGSHTVELTVINSAGHQGSKRKTITVIPGPQLGFYASSVCLGEATIIHNLSVDINNEVESWTWDFGDGSPQSNEKEPESHGFLNSGEYQITLSAVSGNGCTPSITKTAFVYDPPDVSISTSGSLAFCDGDSTILSVVEDEKYQYLWSRDDVLITGADHFTYAVKEAGTYAVEVVNTDANCGAISEKVSLVTIESPPAPAIIEQGTRSFCQGDSIILGTTQIPGYSYQWQQDAVNIASDQHTLTVKETGEYSVFVTNETGCSSSAGSSVPVTAREAPDAYSFSLSASPELCEGDSLIISVPFVADYEYSWRENISALPGEENSSLTVKEAGLYSLLISNSYGCERYIPAVEVQVKRRPEQPALTTQDYVYGECNSDTPIKISVVEPILGYAYNWYRNGFKVNESGYDQYEGFLPNGEYTVEADLNGCTNESEPILIYYKDAPEKPVIYVYGPEVWYLACNGSDYGYYQWYYNGEAIPGENDFMYIANNSLGTYYVIVGNEKGCYTESDPVTIPEGLTSLMERDPFSGFTMYPNPADEKVYLQLENPIVGDITTSLYNMRGKLILQGQNQKNSNIYNWDLDLSQLVQGSYLLHIKIDNYSRVNILIKK